MNPIPVLRPWPQDAVMVVGVEPEAAIAVEGLGPNPTRGVCRGCRCDVLVNPAHVDYAMRHPKRLGRPVMFFCTKCLLGHRLHNVQIEDLRQPAKRPAAGVMQRRAEA